MDLGNKEKMRHEQYTKICQAFDKSCSKSKYFRDPDDKSQKLNLEVKGRDKLAQELVAVRSDLAGIRRSLSQFIS